MKIWKTINWRLDTSHPSISRRCKEECWSSNVSCLLHFHSLRYLPSENHRMFVHCFPIYFMLSAMVAVGSRLYSLVRTVLGQFFQLAVPTQRQCFLGYWNRELCCTKMATYIKKALWYFRFYTHNDMVAPQNAYSSVYICHS